MLSLKNSHFLTCFKANAATWNDDTKTTKFHWDLNQNHISNALEGHWKTCTLSVFMIWGRFIILWTPRGDRKDGLCFDLYGHMSMQPMQCTAMLDSKGGANIRSNSDQF